MTADSSCLPAFAQLYSPTASAMLATWWWRTNGVVYTNTWSGEYYDNTPVHAGGFLVALQDKSGAGKS